MATVTGFTAARMLTIENSTIVSGTVVGNNLILTTRGGTQIDAGSVRGIQGIQGLQGPGPNPAGTFLMGGWTTDPSGYLILDGRLLSGGVAAYPNIASIFPGWVSGANIQLPNADGCVPMVANSATLGVVSGSMTHTLAAANLPPHQHTTADHQHSTPAHAHYNYHSHGGVTYGANVDHTHTIPNHQHVDSGGNGAGLGYGYRDPGGPNIGVDVYNPGSTFVTWVQYPATTHSGGGGTTSGFSQNHAHGLAIDAYNGNTYTDGNGTSGLAGAGSTGTGPGTTTPINHTPKNLTMRMAVKT